jgi:hypothetical protein
MDTHISDQVRREELASIAGELGKLQKRSIALNERFIAFAIASAKRETEARAAEVGMPADPG